TAGDRQGVVLAKGPYVHPGLPHQIQFSPDGSLLAVGDHERVRLWDVATRQEREALPVPLDWGRQVVLSPDGRWLAAGGQNEVIVLDVATGRQERVCRHDDIVTAVAFSPDGGRLLMADKLGNVRLWDAATGGPQASLRGHVGEVFAAAFHP